MWALWWPPPPQPWILAIWIDYASMTQLLDREYCCYSWVRIYQKAFEPRHDKTNKMTVRPAKISLGIRPVWSESSLSAWRKLGSLATHWAHSEDSDQTGWMPRLIWVFAGRTLILLVLSCRGSFMHKYMHSLNSKTGFSNTKYWQTYRISASLVLCDWTKPRLVLSIEFYVLTVLIGILDKKVFRLSFKTNFQR